MCNTDRKATMRTARQIANDPKQFVQTEDVSHKITTPWGT